MKAEIDPGFGSYYLFLTKKLCGLAMASHIFSRQDNHHMHLLDKKGKGRELTKYTR